MAIAKKVEEAKIPKKIIEEEVKKPTHRTETWATARFSYIEMREHPEAVWRISPQGIREEFVDGIEYDRPLSLFNMLNNECREVKRKFVKSKGQELGKYVKTSTFTPRIKFDILKTYDKEIKLTAKELAQL